MGTVITVASRKGGVGKTTLSAILAVEAARADARALMIDLDPQNSLRAWWERREAEAPQMLSEDPDPSRMSSVLGKTRAQFDLVVIDTPPAASSWLRAITELSDLTLVPVQPSPHDLGAISATISELERARWAFVLSRSQARTRVSEAARRELAQHGRVVPTDIRQRVAHAESAIRGLVASESEDREAARECRLLAGWVWADINASWRQCVTTKKGVEI